MWPRKSRCSRGIEDVFFAREGHAGRTEGGAVERKPRRAAEADMPDRSFLAWPFFEDRHRELAEHL
ncbi:hypothetical protein EN841_35755, partial [Mesorhizobium sp. M8A.F.Ca.ET.198.01.1.1]